MLQWHFSSDPNLFVRSLFLVCLRSAIFFSFRFISIHKFPFCLWILKFRTHAHTKHWSKENSFAISLAHSFARSVSKIKFRLCVEVIHKLNLDFSLLFVNVPKIVFDIFLQYILTRLSLCILIISFRLDVIFTLSISQHIFFVAVRVFLFLSLYFSLYLVVYLSRSIACLLASMRVLFSFWLKIITIDVFKS